MKPLTEEEQNMLWDLIAAERDKYPRSPDELPTDEIVALVEMFYEKRDESSVTLSELGKTIWEASRADEGTISFTGANNVAETILARFSVTR